jgi:NADPH-dependent 7-cyano-7-deazaguanine reductase QueF-like protein
MPTSPGPSTSNNWGWADILKRVFTLVELSPLHKNGLPSLSVTWVTTHSKMWVITHSKQEVSTTAQKELSTTAQENIFKKIMKDQVGRIERS